MRSYLPEILLGLILCLTAVLTVRPEAEALPPAVTVQAASVPEPQSYDEQTPVRLLVDGKTETLSLHDYLIGVLLSEVPATFDSEALRAQAIASRTFALHCAKHDGANVCADSGCCQCWADDAALRERLGAEYDGDYSRAAAAVESTDGQVLEYSGGLIDATFFACSGGMTEDATAVWGGSVPYLRPVESPGEEQAGSYHSQARFTPEEFAQILLAEAPQARLTGDPAAWTGSVELTPGRGVGSMELGGVSLSLSLIHI